MTDFISFNAFCQSETGMVSPDSGKTGMVSPDSGFCGFSDFQLWMSTAHFFAGNDTFYSRVKAVPHLGHFCS
jgi:hypothetical protein